MTEYQVLRATVGEDKEDNFVPGDQFDGEWAICPHCGYKMGDCWEWVKPEPREMECDECHKTYRVYAEHAVHYITEALEDGDE